MKRTAKRLFTTKSTKITKAKVGKSIEKHLRSHGVLVSKWEFLFVFFVLFVVRFKGVLKHGDHRTRSIDTGGLGQADR